MVSPYSCRLLSNHVTRVQQANRGQLFDIFDGMSSISRAGDAARYMGDRPVTFYDDTEQQPANVLNALLTNANNEIADWEVPLGNQWKRAGGCAGTVALLIESQILLFHTGDTRALLLKGDYHSEDDHIALTTSHNSSQSGLTSFWGIGKDLAIDHTEHPFKEDDILLLATDGLTDVFSNEEICRMVRQMNYFTPDEWKNACSELCRMGRKRGSGDDISVLFIYREE